MSSEPGPDPTANPVRRVGRWLLALGPAAVLLGIALVCFIGFGLSLILVLNAQASATPWVETRAEVVVVKTVTSVEFDEETNGRRPVTRYLTEVRYVADGVEYVRAAHFDRENRYRVGDQITVYYDPADPQEVRTAEPGAMVPWLLGGLGSAFVLIFGIVGLVMRARGSSWGPGIAVRRPVPSKIDWATDVPPGLASSRRQAERVMSIVGVAACAGSLIAAGIIASLELRKADWAVTEGTVVGSSMQRNDSGRTSYAPQVAYTVDGREFTHRSSVYSGTEPEIGATMAVRYDPADPAQASVVTIGWVAVLLAGIGVGVLILCCGVGLLLRRRPTLRPERQST